MSENGRPYLKKVRHYLSWRLSLTDDKSETRTRWDATRRLTDPDVINKVSNLAQRKLLSIDLRTCLIAAGARTASLDAVGATLIGGASLEEFP